MASSALIHLIDLNATFGALFIGFGCSSVAFGVLSMQAYSYFRRYPLDVWWYKAMVALIWILELVDQAFIGHAVYFYVVTNWGQATVLLEAPVWSLILQVPLGAAVGAIVKVCYGLRVWRFSKHNIPVTMLITVGALGQLAAAFVYTVRAVSVPSLAEVGVLKFVGTVALGLGMATDMFTAISLCWFLRNLKTGFKKDDSIVNKLTIYAINTGVVSSAFSLCTLVLYDMMPTNFIFILFYFVLTKVYANSFYAALNTRRSVRGRGTEAEQTTMPTFLMVQGQTSMKHEDGHDNPILSTTIRAESNGGLSPASGKRPLATLPPMHYQTPYSGYDRDYIKASQVKSWS